MVVAAEAMRDTLLLEPAALEGLVEEQTEALQAQLRLPHPAKQIPAVVAAEVVVRPERATPTREVLAAAVSYALDHTSKIKRGRDPPDGCARKEAI